MIYDTGLLPLTRGAAVMSFPDQKYPSLASILARKESLQFIADSRKVWNYESSSKQYHYDRLYDETDLKDATLDRMQIGKDKALFTFAGETLCRQSQPFYAEIITLSMHLPFREESVKRIEAFDNSGHSSTFNDYITSVRFFDEQFASFIERFKAAGIYDNTIFFLGSDHNILVQDEGHNNEFKDYIAFIAINAGAKPDAVVGEIRQTDVFPTMLDIAGRGNAPWKGLGISLFASDYRAAIQPNRRQQAQEISDLIIRGNYLAQ